MLHPRKPPVLTEQQVVGHGATSTVLKSYVVDPGGFARLRPGSYIAVKRMRVTQDKVSVMEREVATHKSLSHPNIVTCYGCYVEETTELNQHVTTFNLLLDYCDGGSLYHVYSRKDDGVPVEALKSYAYQALQGLVYLHEMGIVHRDLKALNMLLTNDGVCKLSDFGAATNLNKVKDRVFKSMQGTTFWMAPEMFELGVHSEGRGTSAADIWSFGATVWELAAGCRPFSQLQADFQLPLFLSDQPEEEYFKGADCESLPEVVMNFVKRCMRKDPSARPTASQLLQDPLFAGLQVRERKRQEASPPASLDPSPSSASATQAPNAASTLAPPQPSSPQQQQAARPTSAAVAATAPLSPPQHFGAGSDSEFESDGAVKLATALDWWFKNVARAECAASDFFRALKCPNLEEDLYPIVTFRRNGGATDGKVTMDDFLTFTQWFGPFDAFAKDAKDLGDQGAAYANYNGYGDYGYTSDAPRILWTWHSRLWFRPLWNQQQAEEHLRGPGKQAGHFVIRFSSKWKESPGSYTLSLRGERGVSHYRITRPTSTWSFVVQQSAKENPLYFDNLEDLVSHFKVEGLRSANGDNVYKLIE